MSGTYPRNQPFRHNHHYGALFRPGTSRSCQVLHASFCPDDFGAGVLVAYELYQSGNIAEIANAVDGVLYSFVASLLAIYIMMWWLKKSTFLPFVIYRILLGGYLLLESYGYLNNTIQ